jgi:hypothetical protein
MKEIPYMEELWANTTGLLDTEAKTGVKVDMAKHNACNTATEAYSTQAEEMRFKVKAFEEMIERRMKRDGWNGSIVLHVPPSTWDDENQIGNYG